MRLKKQNHNSFNEMKTNGKRDSGRTDCKFDYTFKYHDLIKLIE